MSTSNIAYATEADVTITLASLATDASLLTGVESTAISNTSNLYLDYHLGGKITVGTTPTINTFIEVWIYAAWDPNGGTFVYPDVFDGTASAETVTSAAIKRSSLRRAAAMLVDATTSDRSYYFGPVSIAALYGGVCPQAWGVFVTHNTGVNLNSTAGNHQLTYYGIEETVA